MKRKKLKLALIFLYSIFACAASAWVLITMVRWRDIRSIGTQLSAAVEQIKKGPQGVDGAEAFVAALKRIDPGHAPEEVKLALRDYILASEQDLREWKTGHPTAEVDNNMTQAREKLVQSLRRNQ